MLGYCRPNTAQNLVKNPSFENLNSCPFLSTKLNWFVNDWWSMDSSSAEIFNSCDVNGYGQLPSTHWGYQYPRTGNSMVNVLFMYTTTPNIRGGFVYALINTQPCSATKSGLRTIPNNYIQQAPPSFYKRNK